MKKIFNIHNIDDSYSFIHININDKDAFFSEFCQYILDEDNLLQYVENETSITFSPSKRNYIKLYKHLYKFIDDEALVIELDIDEDLRDIILVEEEVVSENSNKIKIRLSKIGRIGEYIGHLVLSKYFNLTCVIPKISLTTDKNMSVFGIDELFFDKDKQILFFGESKVSNSVENGIALVKKSLKNYEREIKEEFKLVLSEEKIKKHPEFKIMQDKINECIDFEEFTKKMNIDKVGVPIFVAHGKELDKNEILKYLATIKRSKLFNLDTIYIVISLPIISKSEFIKYLIPAIRYKMEEYERNR